MWQLTELSRDSLAPRPLSPKEEVELKLEWGMIKTSQSKSAPEAGLPCLHMVPTVPPDSSPRQYRPGRAEPSVPAEP